MPDEYQFGEGGNAVASMLAPVVIMAAIWSKLGSTQTE